MTSVLPLSLVNRLAQELFNYLEGTHVWLGYLLLAWGLYTVKLYINWGLRLNALWDTNQPCS